MDYKLIVKCTCKIRRHRWISKLENYITCLLLSLKDKAEKRRIAFDIDRDDILDLYEKQDKKCALTGIKMTHVRDDPEHGIGHHYLYNISVDRIDSNGIYEKGNIQLICSILNQIKWDIPNDVFIKTCKQFVRHNNITKLVMIPGDPLFSQVSPANLWPTVPLTKNPNDV